MTQPAQQDRHRIVVGVDGSQSSLRALRWAGRIAPGLGAGIDAVHVWSTPVSFGWAYLPTDWHPVESAEKILSAAVDEVFGPDRPKDLRLVIREGYPSEVLLRESRGADMLVLGSRGHGGFVGLLIGSVSQYCAEHATCPVLVVHAPALAEQPSAAEVAGTTAPASPAQ